MSRDEFIKRLTSFLEELKDYGVPDGMTDQTFFDVVVGLESVIDIAVENEDE